MNCCYFFLLLYEGNKEIFISHTMTSFSLITLSLNVKLYFFLYLLQKPFVSLFYNYVLKDKNFSVLSLTN